jgi:RND family efflux transporter MFP subunit
MSSNSKLRSLLSKKPLWLALVAVGVLVPGAYFLKARAESEDVGTTFVARRGPLDITVLEGGTIESEEKGEIKCEVKGGQGVKILKIVEEGYQITEDDVKAKKVLVELDAADLRNKITPQEITFGSTAASLTDAQQGYDIQVNQNLSDVMAAAQKARFARMDFTKYMGDQAAGAIVGRLGIKAGLAEAIPSPAELLAASVVKLPQMAQGQTDASAQPAAPAPVASGAAPAKAGEATAANPPTAPAQETSPPVATTNAPAAPVAVAPAPSTAIDFSKYADIDALGDGEAKQKLRELRDAVQTAQKELQQAQSTLEGTTRLFKKDFVTKIEMDQAQLTYDNCVLKVKKADTALNLFEKYEFPKAAEEALSKYTEALRELDRTKKGAISRLAQADAKLKSAQAKYSLEEKQLKELYEQLDKCLIRAPRPGLVVYGGGGEIMYWRGEEQIREGATVRERQTVITVPDMRKMCVKVKIHESYIKKVQKGQKVRITADAVPDRKLEGEVTQVGMLPDSENTWLNPDMKVYRTTIKITGEHDWIRPGMTAKAEILVNRLEDVVYVPIQAVNPLEDKKVCYIADGGKPEQRDVEVGEFNEAFIEIKTGIQEGERVCLRTPAAEEGQGAEGQKKAPSTKESSASQSKPASTAAPSK